MHEAGIAVAVAAEMRDRGLDPASVRLVVSGGHGDRASFDAALRVHLEAAAPGRGLSAVTIVHAPSPCLCAHCAASFETADPDGACPACGGPGIAVPVHESIALEWTDDIGGHPADGPVRPADHDPRLSTPAPAGGRLGA